MWNEKNYQPVLITVVLLSLCGYFFISAITHLQTERNDIVISTGPPAGRSLNFNLAVVGDIHVEEDLNSLVSLSDLLAGVTNANPDLILFVGDYTESPSRVTNMSLHRQRIINAFKKIEPIPTAFVLGNYETRSNADLWYTEMTSVGLNVLENEVLRLQTRKGLICVRGLGDRYSRRFQYVDYPESCDGIAKLTITHDPYGAFHDRIRGLVIAGHTHCGQIRLPLVGVIWVPTAAPEHAVCGFYEDERRSVFITSGVGTSLLPVRYGAQSQWDFIRLQMRD